MTGLAAAILGALALLVLLPTLVLFIEVLMACLPARLPPAARVPRPRLAVLVPAHDEASIIIATLDSIRAQLCEGDRLLVVADNCTDDTAALARAAGAEVVERFDAQARGKGYALDFGVRYLGFDPPPVIVVVDADCQLGEGALTRLATCCIDSGRPVQALYLMQAPEGAGLKTRVAEFAWRVKNLVRPRGWARLGLPCQLMGAGMAFTWRDLASLELASGHLVEDLKMGLDLCRIGKAPLFCPDARVTSWFPVSNEGLGAQRRRWEHGHLGVLLKDAPRLLIESLARRNGALLALALDLMVPPLALLVLALAGVFCLSWLAWLLLDVSTAPWLASCAVVLLGIAVLLAWYRFCRGLIAFSVLLYAPLYAAKKIPIYLGFLVKRQVDWVRSKRDGN
ncbi:Glycosyltransferase, catalytic subunit of cellulose synthase and poly-beta-1,6-N-acetylglucosamine synthase [Pseudomonas guariconensis]|uniref:Glycosyl transferase n=1 Tax=Pseudomonas guariconensis TaxID=1288410 RepID=A0AAX0W354_9PSED|nr:MULTISPECIES: glycosyltransferase family 2 protein [Pseudomonas]MBH3359238.1 glycosyltransferase [Pseudomonas guariconensis]MCO7620502.1 glycosyltransferase family 2 protein [Pseudomonas guariconensis]MDM9592459.1 glycosyltransferase family 2 protein [Pseudomonas guariconensis]MDM9605286.1 glycosyltransferase family 2 protein [Pseudomonas guariconensis]MDM9610243.1 glycosyltransferase family 2 protein [Pseudomonas guariconensis]